MALAACAFPAPAAAGDGGGTTAPSGPRTDAGGSSYDDGFALAERQRRAAARERRRQAAARERRRRTVARRRERRAATRQRAQALTVERGHSFPLAGPFSYGADDARFGARRRGHRHQGHDLSAAEGTPVVAPHGGVVEFVQYQRRGAGHYVVLDADDEDRDYVFMHLRTGSIVVRAGQHLRTGELLGEVGNSGRSFGAHLHFEVWVGGWQQQGGEPVDPLPLLQVWAASS